MSFQQPAVQGDWVPGSQHRYVLTNFKIAHEKVEQQRSQLDEQERQVAQLRSRIALLEGGSNPRIRGSNGNTVDDFSIKNSASQLDKLINRWATEVVRVPPVPLQDLCRAILSDVVGGGAEASHQATSMQVQNYLRHAISEAISEGIINCLIVTNSQEANVQLTRIHEHLFARDPIVACVWRRQTFSAAVESCTPDMSMAILKEHVPTLMAALQWQLPTAGNTSIIDSAYAFSRMLHGGGSSSAEAFYRAFVPEMGSALYPTQIELVKRCPKSERGAPDTVGATIFPGLVKVSRSPSGEETIQTVVRRAQVICDCALRVVPQQYATTATPGLAPVARPELSPLEIPSAFPPSSGMAAAAPLPQQYQQQYQEQPAYQQQPTYQQQPAYQQHQQQYHHPPATHGQPQHHRSQSSQSLLSQAPTPPQPRQSRDIKSTLGYF